MKPPRAWLSTELTCHPAEQPRLPLLSWQISPASRVPRLLRHPFQLYLCQVRPHLWRRGKKEQSKCYTSLQWTGATYLLLLMLFFMDCHTVSITHVCLGRIFFYAGEQGCPMRPHKRVMSLVSFYYCSWLFTVTPRKGNNIIFWAQKYT